MHAKYDPKQHIQRVDTPPRSDEVFDQREITIQSYQTTVPFDYEKLNDGLESAWLTPQIRFGVFHRSPSPSKVECTVVLGLQDKLSIRDYDYDTRRPIWYNWMDAIVDTVNIRYFKDENGLVRFTTTGGGRRITDERLEDFNRIFLGITKDAVTKRQFDLERLRDLCFVRFVDRLYMVRFSDPSGEEYRSIDHALFQSRKYIRPDTGRLKEVRSDSKVKIESFDSDVNVRCDDLSDEIQVRFFIKGLSGSLRLRFPRLSYVCQPSTPEEQADIFYRVVDKAVSAILDADYYTQKCCSLEDLDTGLEMFPDMVGLAPFRKVLIGDIARKEFFDKLDLGAPWSKWLPHLRALSELVVSEAVVGHTAELLQRMMKCDPAKAVRLLDVCRGDPKTAGLGAVVAGAVSAELQSVPAEMRSRAEEVLQAWAIEHEEDTWDVSFETGEITVYNLRWRVEDLSIDVLPAVVWKLVGLLHHRLRNSKDDIGLMLQRLNWCMTVAKELPANHSKMETALRLVAENKVPLSVADGSKLLKKPVNDLDALDVSVLDHFGLPLWPCLEATRQEDRVKLVNTGIGVALDVQAAPTGMLSSDAEASCGCNLGPGEVIELDLSGNPSTLDVVFSKYGVQYRVALPITRAKKTVYAPDSGVMSHELVQQTVLLQATQVELGEGIRELKEITSPLPAAIAKVGDGIAIVQQHVRGVPILQAELAEARINPEGLALEIQKRIADILTPEEQRIWMAVRTAGTQKEALESLREYGIGSTATLSRYVREIDKKLVKNNLPKCAASEPAARFKKSVVYSNSDGNRAHVDVSPVEKDWAEDPGERDTTIRAYLAARDEDKAYFRQTKPGIEDEAKMYLKRRQ